MLRIVQCLLLGLGIGGLSGMLGIGGGVILLPALYYLFQYEQPEAAGITLLVLAVPVVLPGAWRYYANGIIKPDHFVVAAWIAAGFAVGSFAGAEVLTHLAVHSKEALAAVRVGFGLMMVYVAGRFILSGSSEVAATAGGVATFAVAWVSYWMLKMLARKHLSKPDLGQHIRDRYQPPTSGPDYYI